MTHRISHSPPQSPQRVTLRDGWACGDAEGQRPFGIMNNHPNLILNHNLKKNAQGHCP